MKLNSNTEPTDRIVDFWKDELKLREQQCNIANVSCQRERLVCPDCKLPFTKEELQVKEHCFNCGWEFVN